MSNNYNSTLQSNNTDLQAILNTINELPEASEQATPSIEVGSNGLITATAGTKTSTHQLAFQPAKTIRPSTTSQIAVSSGYYTGGNITVQGDANLVAGNIKSGVSIFGVSGTYAGSGSGGNTSIEDAMVTGTLSTYTNSRVTSVGDYAFAYCALTEVSFPNATTIGSYAFQHCSSLTSANFPQCKSIGSYAFYFCSSLKSANFPQCTSIDSHAFDFCINLTSASFPQCKSIGGYAFQYCSRLKSVSFPNCMSIGSYAFDFCSGLRSASFPKCTIISNSAFYACTVLSSIYLTGSFKCTLSNSNAFSQTSIWSNKGSIFVPASLVSYYKTATNWAFFSNRIYGV